MKQRTYDYDAILADYNLGDTIAAIAARHGCCKGTVHVVARGAGATKKPWRKNYGYRKRTSQGYVFWVIRYWKDSKRRYAYILEHRVLMEKKLGRPLERFEAVHHKNAVRDDNRLSNLAILHERHHKPGPTHCRHCGLSL